MGTEKKLKAPASAAELEAEAQDEIEGIMNEIKGLQKDLAEAPKPKPAAAAKPAPKPAPAPVAAVAVAAEETVVEEDHEPVMDVAPDEGLEEFRGAGGDASIEETLGHLPEEPPAPGSLLGSVGGEETAEVATEVVAESDEEVFEETVEEEHATVSELPTKSKKKSPAQTDEGEGGTLTMTLTGNMKLKLQYECDGQEVTVGFADEAFSVQFSDGTELKVPVRRGLAKAA